jgi:hypothetical protein
MRISRNVGKALVQALKSSNDAIVIASASASAFVVVGFVAINEYCSRSSRVPAR